MKRERYTFMIKVWDTLKNKTQQMLLKQENEELKEDQGKEIDYHRYWKDQYEKEHKLRQEAENEVILIKGITVINSPELRAANKKIADLEKKLKQMTHLADPVQKARESGL